MSSPDLWDTRHREALDDPQACTILQQHSAHLPRRGQALDLACGRGGNALWLARRGLTVHAWDYSEAGIRYLRAEAEKHRLTVQTEVRDVVLRPPEAGQFDLLVVSHFLNRSLMPSLLAAVRPGGLLYYQTFLVGHSGSGPRNPDFLLRPGELSGYCSAWKILHSLEQDGQAQLVARRRVSTNKAIRV